MRKRGKEEKRNFLLHPTYPTTPPSNLPQNKIGRDETLRDLGQGQCNRKFLFSSFPHFRKVCFPHVKGDLLIETLTWISRLPIETLTWISRLLIETLTWISRLLMETLTWIPRFTLTSL